MLDFGTVREWNPGNCDGGFTVEGFSRKAQFAFDGEFFGELDARHYPWNTAPSPSNLHIPTESVGAPASTLPFEGAQLNTTDDRVVVSRYVEYFTIQEILDHQAGIQLIPDGFLAAEANASYKFADANTIGAFRVTDPSGFTYHYSLPVYKYDQVSGSYPLNSDYSSLGITRDQLAFSYNGADYMATYNEGGINMIVEHREGQPLAMRWMLTAITGPNYKDVNADEKVGDEDAGYWVKYHYALWTNAFHSRSPLYGYNYSYNKVQDDPSHTGHYADFTSADFQLWYLNRIETSSHTAVFVRDIREDEHSAIDHNLYNNQFPVVENINSNGTEANMPVSGVGSNLTSWSGTLYDNGGPNVAGGPNGDYILGTSTITIAPAGAVSTNKVVLDFEQFYLASYGNDPKNVPPPNQSQIGNYYNPDLPCQGHYLEFFDGTDDNPQNKIAMFGIDEFCGMINSASRPRTISSTGPALTIKMTATGPDPTHLGFKANWSVDGPGSAVQQAWKGTLYDDGGDAANYSHNQD
ncbi:MAG: hypothetical protein AAGB22_09425, partial [Bacteroidota bacterium]